MEDVIMALLQAMADYVTETKKEREELRMEREILLQQIERSIDEQMLVELPREVAEALEESKEWSNNNCELIAWHIPGRKDGYWSILYRFADSDGGFFKLIDALRYGYKVHEKLEKSLETTIRQTVKGWLDLPDVEGERDVEKQADFLTELLVAAVNNFEPEAAQRR